MAATGTSASLAELSPEARRSTVQGLSRLQLQALAKSYGVKASVGVEECNTLSLHSLTHGDMARQTEGRQIL